MGARKHVMEGPTAVITDRPPQPCHFWGGSPSG
jgi:hypothetical protein